MSQGTEVLTNGALVLGQEGQAPRVGYPPPDIQSREALTKSFLDHTTFRSAHALSSCLNPNELPLREKGVSALGRARECLTQRARGLLLPSPGITDCSQATMPSLFEVKSN